MSLSEIDLKELSKIDKKTICSDVQMVEFEWPIGMLTCKPLGGGLYEVRSSLSFFRIFRVIFCMYGEEMILLYGFLNHTFQKKHYRGWIG